MLSKSYYTMPFAFRWWHNWFHIMGPWNPHILYENNLIRTCSSCEVYETMYDEPKPKAKIRGSNVAM